MLNELQWGKHAYVLHYHHEKHTLTTSKQEKLRTQIHARPDELYQPQACVSLVRHTPVKFLFLC